MAKTPTCPYCGGEMQPARRNSIFWHVCGEDGAESPCELTEREALEKAMHRTSPWRSIKDGLPDSGTVCVVHGHNRRGVECYDIAYRSKAGWEFGSLTSFEIEHWMAVPDAPKEGEHNADT